MIDLGQGTLSDVIRNLAELEDDIKLASEIKDRLKEAEKARAPVEKTWKECLAFIENIQYIISDLETPVWLNTQANSRPGSEKVIDNLIFDHARRLHAQLTRPTFAPTITAATDMPEDHDAARIAQALCRNHYHAYRLPRIIRQLTWWIVVAGPAWIETYFDPNENNGKGRAGMVLRSPFQVFVDPRFQEWELARWAIVTEVAAREDVLDRYADLYKARTGKDLAKDIPKDSVVKTNIWMPEPAIRPGADATGISQPPPAAKGAVTVVRYYERPSRKFPKGRHAVLVEDKLVHRGDLETPGARIPLTPFGFWMRPWEMYARSPVSMVISLQRLNNYALGRWYEHIKRWAAGYLVKDTLSGITRGSITNQPDIITHNPGHPPKFEFPPFGNTQAYMAFRNTIMQAIESRMALPPIARAEMPKGARAARTLEILRELSEEVMYPIISDLATQWVEVWTQMIGWMQMFYQDDTIASIIGHDKMGVVQTFRTGLIPANWEDRLIISVETGGALPTGRLARIQTILDLSRKDLLFGRPGTPEHARQLKRALGFDEGYLESETDLDRSIAQMENARLRQGEMLPVHEFDDDETHIMEHLAYIKQLTIIGERNLQALMQHINQHRAQLAGKHKQIGSVAQAAEQAAQQQPQVPPVVQGNRPSRARRQQQPQAPVQGVPFGAQGQRNVRTPVPPGGGMGQQV